MLAGAFYSNSSCVFLSGSPRCCQGSRGPHTRPSLSSTSPASSRSSPSHPFPSLTWVDLRVCRACLDRAFLSDSASSSRTGVRYDLQGKQRQKEAEEVNMEIKADVLPSRLSELQSCWSPLYLQTSFELCLLALLLLSALGHPSYEQGKCTHHLLLSGVLFTPIQVLLHSLAKKPNTSCSDIDLKKEILHWHIPPCIIFTITSLQSAAFISTKPITAESSRTAGITQRRNVVQRVKEGKK